MIGALVICVFWILLLFVVAGVGLAFSRIVLFRTSRSPSLLDAMWLGVFSILLLLKTLVFIFGISFWGIWILLIFAAGAGWASYLSRSHHELVPMRMKRAGFGVLVVVLSGTTVAFLSLGTPSNFDSGLYHIGFIRHLADGRMALGLANLNFAFGYSSGALEFAGLLTSLPASDQNFRFLNGFLILLLIVDSVARQLPTSRTTSLWPRRTSLLSACLVATYVIQFPQGLLSSPTPDTGSLVVTVASITYLAKLLNAKNSGDETAAMTFGFLLIAAALIRPQNWLLLVTIFPVILFMRRINRHDLVWLLGLAAYCGILAIVQNALMTGWPFYPLGVWALDVPWAMSDPAVALGDIESAAQSSIQNAFQDFGGPESTNYLLRNGIFFILLLASLCLLAVGMINRVTRVRALLVAAPLITFLVANALIAPDPRFFGGVIIGLFSAIVSLLLPSASGVFWTQVIAGSFVLASLAVAFVRGVPAEVYSQMRQGSSVATFGIDLKIGQLPEPLLASREVTGQTVFWPESGFQCWDSPTPCTREKPDLLLGRSAFNGWVMWTVKPQVQGGVEDVR